MKKSLALLSGILLTVLLSRCSHGPMEAMNEVILGPADPDEKLKVDEQFLEKSRSVGANQKATSKKSRRRILTP